MLRRFLGKQPRQRTVAALDVSTGKFRQEVVGEASYQPALRRLSGGKDRVELRVLLVPEPRNAYDSNAIAVVAPDGEATIGYLPREVAAQYQAKLLEVQRKRDRLVSCMAVMVGGARPKISIGVWLDCDLDQELME